MHLMVRDDTTGKIFCVKGRRVFAADTAENALQLLFCCRLSNINQILTVPEGLILKNTAGKIIKYDRTGREIWHISLGNDICTDDDCLYDKLSDRLYSFCHSHRTGSFYLYEADNFTGAQTKKPFYPPQADGNGEVHSYCLLAAENGTLCYAETIYDTDTDKAVSRVFQGEKIIWETPCFLSGATQICGNKYYNYHIFFDLDARQVISFDKKGIPLPVYEVVKFKDGYCLTAIESGKNKLIFTDRLFNIRAKKIISSGNIFSTEESVYILRGEKMKRLNLT